MYARVGRYWLAVPVATTNAEPEYCTPGVMRTKRCEVSRFAPLVELVCIIKD